MRLQCFPYHAYSLLPLLPLPAPSPCSLPLLPAPPTPLIVVVKCKTRLTCTTDTSCFHTSHTLSGEDLFALGTIHGSIFCIRLSVHFLFKLQTFTYRYIGLDTHINVGMKSGKPILKVPLSLIIFNMNQFYKLGV